MNGPTPDFWQAKFDQGHLPWDRGGPSPHLQHWLASGLLPPPPARVLVPGCGSGWELLALGEAGYHVRGLDYTPGAVALAQTRVQESGLTTVAVEQADVLAYSPQQPVDWVYEQTCLCALHPSHWRDYGDRLWSWLSPGGTLAILFMQMHRPESIQQGLVQGPPYHCDLTAMHAVFPGSRWLWPAPPYESVPHHNGSHELAVLLIRR